MRAFGLFVVLCCVVGCLCQSEGGCRGSSCGVESPSWWSELARKVKAAADPLIVSVKKVLSAAEDLRLAEQEVRFQQWAAEHGVSYASEDERVEALFHWRKADNFIAEHNSNPKWTYRVSHNKFSDLSDEQFRLQYRIGEHGQNVKLREVRRCVRARLYAVAVAIHSPLIPQQILYFLLLLLLLLARPRHSAFPRSLYACSTRASRQGKAPSIRRARKRGTVFLMRLTGGTPTRSLQ